MSTTKTNGDSSESTCMILETGFSLSEQAHESLEQLALYSNPTSASASTSTSTTTSTTTGTGTGTSRATTSTLQELRQQVVNDVVGSDAVVTSPLEFTAGHPVHLPLVYCDFTASHRPLLSIEGYLKEQCLPLYGNTHTNTSLTGSQSTAFCSEARQLVGEACGAKTTGKASQDVVLFAGNGTTCAVQLLIDCLGLKHANAKANTNAEDNAIHEEKMNKPIIFVGPYEHHSNLVPWRELGHVDIEHIPWKGAADGNIDLQHLEQMLKRYASRTIKIGSFSAASNVTGVVADDLAITALLHRYGALSVWDYATGASYLEMQMNPSHPDYESALVAKDAIVWSGHKVLGGVGTPGVLVIKKHLVSQQNPPTRSGGGTVFYVTADHHRFLSNRIERYEGGTPNVVGIWRLGLAMTAKQQLKRQFQQQLALALALGEIGEGGTYVQTLIDYDQHRAKQIQARLLQIPNLVLMDGDYTPSISSSNSNSSNNTQSPRKMIKLPIFSFLIQCGNRFLHYNYVCALLNDVFGIQSRGGCQCAGPFAQRLLGLQGQGTVNDQVEECLVHTKDELLRPGFTRLSLPTLGTTQELQEHVLYALQWVAHNGWKFLHVYRCNHRTGEWRHKSRPGAPLGKTERKWLSHYRTNGVPSGTNGGNSTALPPSLEKAKRIATEMLELVVQDQSSLMQAVKMTHEDDQDSSTLAALRWYVYPKEVAAYLQQGLDQVPGTLDRQTLVGAIRPIAWYPQGSSATAVTETETTATDTPQSEPNSVGAESHHDEAVPFREGEHSGSAPWSELQQGHDDGELTDICQVYNSTMDTWEPITEAIVGHLSKPASADIASLQSLATRDISTFTTTGGDGMLSFRDGEHTGSASWEELEAGFDDGEITKGCLIYDAALDLWTPITSILVQKRPLALDDRADDDNVVNIKASAALVSSTGPVDIGVVDKNEKKKPQRDSTAWGQGNIVTMRPSADPNTLQLDRKKRHKHIKPPAKLMRLVTQAMIQWDMLEEGDRLLLGLSGGKDSLSLLHVLLEFQKKLPINFEIEVCTIDPQTPSFDPSPLIPYVESLGVKYHYIRDDIIERASNAGNGGKMVSSLCSFCARMKRGNLYSCARKNNCNKLVLAQHLDDLAESFMMSVMHNGFLRTMKANYKINAGDLSVIRPLVYCRESLMTDFAQSSNLPLINENCPACFEEPKERARIKKLLSREETLYPNFFDNIKRSLLPLMHDDSTAILRSYTEEAVAKSRKENQNKKRLNGSKYGNANITRQCEDVEEEKKESFDSCSPPLEETEKVKLSVAEASEADLVMELARRRAEKFRLAGAMKGDDDDATGQVCTLNGGNGSIPCRELME